MSEKLQKVSLKTDSSNTSATELGDIILVPEKSCLVPKRLFLMFPKKSFLVPDKVSFKTDSSNTSATELGDIILVSRKVLFSSRK
jgi:hypothetical protein